MDTEESCGGHIWGRDGEGIPGQEALLGARPPELGLKKLFST
jgi:hypothetical protein